jgi:uncharacterized protein DUF1835
LLHITNGDCAVAVLSRAVCGSILPWRDVLHEGPVRPGLSLEDLSRERAAFIASAGWAVEEKVVEDFQSRDAAFRRAGQHDEIVLWFEHDLYDQLQLIQVLDGLSGLRGPPISLVCEAEYLGTMAPERAVELFGLRGPVTRRHMQEASAAWSAFRSPHPQGLEDVKATSLPFLRAALRRHLEEFPWTTDGLSRTERQVIQTLRDGPLSFQELFGKTQKLEEPVFLGDVVLAWHLERLAEEGFVESRDASWSLLGTKRRQRLPRWLGGYEVKDETLRWDPALGRLVAAG